MLKRKKGFAVSGREPSATGGGGAKKIEISLAVKSLGDGGEKRDDGG